VLHTSANLLDDPTEPTQALEVPIPADILSYEVYWIRTVNEGPATVWLQVYDSLLVTPPAVNIFPPTCIRAGETQLIPAGVRCAIAIAALASLNENGTGVPTVALWVDFAYDVGL